MINNLKLKYGYEDFGWNWVDDLSTCVYMIFIEIKIPIILLRNMWVNMIYCILNMPW